MMSIKSGWLPIAIMALGVAAGRAQAPAAGAASIKEQTTAWQALAKLPDWSGNWEAVSFKKHMLGHGRAPYKDLNPPFNAQWMPKFESYKKIAYEGGNFPSRADRCISYGVPGDMDHPGVTPQFLFTPGQVTIITPQFWRIIHTDGRAHDDRFETFQGDSIGHWESDGTLVVSTTGLDPGDEFILGIAQGKGSSVVERFHRQDANTLIDDITLTAPEVLTESYHYQVTYVKAPETLVEFDCAQNNRDINDKGDKVFDLTPPPQ